MTIPIEMLIRLAGLAHFFQIPGMFIITTQVLNLDSELKKLNPFAALVMRVICAGVLLLVLALGALVAIFPAEIITQPLGRALAWLLFVFWLARAGAQLAYSIHMRTRLAYSLHFFLLCLFPVQSAIFLTAALLPSLTPSAPQAEQLRGNREQ